MRTTALRFLAAAGLALAATMAAALVATPAQAAGPRPLFQMPFPCGEEWRFATYAGHDDYEIDMTRRDYNSSGRAIVASFAGKVTDSGYSGGAGNRVRIYHGGGWQTEYYHMISAPIVSVGEQVTRGQVLGYVGSTGDSSGPHLHYAQRKDGTESALGTVVQSYIDGLPFDITDDARANSFFLTSNNCSYDKPAGNLRDVTKDGKSDLLVQRGNGDIYLRRGTGVSGTAAFDSGVLVCGGCGIFDSANIEDVNNDGKLDLFVREISTSNMYVYPNTASSGTPVWGTRILVCGGCGGFDLPDVGDVNNDGKADLFVREGTNMYVYPGIGATGTISWGTRVLVCGGCGAFTMASVDDANGDGKGDLIARDGTDIYVYPGIGATGTISWGTRVLICGACGSFDTVAFGNATNSGNTDLLVRTSAAGVLYVYPGIGSAGTVSWGSRYTV